MNVLTFSRLTWASAAGLTALALTLGACGSISDPTRASGLGAAAPAPKVRKVSGALVGAAAPNLHVALVWKVGTTSAAVLGDAVVTDGHFTIELPTVPEEFLAPAETDFLALTGGLDWQSGAPDGTQEGSGRPVDPDAGSDVLEGEVGGPLRSATAGLVAYLDTNGNGQLDIEQSYVSSPDELVGGNSEIVLVYLRGGGPLDHEKLADRSAVRSHPGFNLAWFERRWLSLEEAQLTLGSLQVLPKKVCSFLPGKYGDRGLGIIGMPPVNDPRLHCAADGLSWTYDQPPAGDCPAWARFRTGTLPSPWPPPANGLCLYRFGSNYGQCHEMYSYVMNPSGYSSGHRADWPCPIPSQGYVPTPGASP
jgi:hypothetical protein